MLVKICGVTTPGDMEPLGRAGADLVGLWHGVPGGHADLPTHDLAPLAAAAHRVPGLRPVLVTFLQDAGALRTVLAGAGVRWVQLHGYQPPGMVRALKSAGEFTVVKVVHLDAGGCVERPLIAAYERAGTDLFLLDTVARDGRIGSTGQPPDPGAVLAIADRLSRPFLLAGGVSDRDRGDRRAVGDHPLFRGIDVDTAARDPGGRLRAGRVRAVSRSWRTPHGTGDGSGATR
ncbi:N-(5'-phosphoribosyl)anthranilate isomerase [Streptomyces sp. NPDC000594]|uniref:phosphoribosylanthranilate isomerase n=1 Tax=Streptomyces sp. NPDC000594 TaxID=3154261 RepID=UPI003322CE29